MKSTRHLPTILLLSLCLTPCWAATSLLASEAISPPTVVVSEIMYHIGESFHPQFATEEVQNSSFEFFELANLTDEVIHLDGWWMRDDNELHRFDFPPGSVIHPFNYMVVANNPVILRQAYGNLNEQNCVGGWDFKLRDSIDNVEIYDNLGFQIDFVRYGDGKESDPDDPIYDPNRRFWPPDPDGDGYSLVLADLASDNSLWFNWLKSDAFRGSPGWGPMDTPTPTATPTNTASPTNTPTATATPTSTGTPTPWIDLNLDSVVGDDLDLLLLLDLMKNETNFPEVNGDGKLNFQDLLIFSQHWQKGS
jgi:Lamin Tail Domain